MKETLKKKNTAGFTLIELMLVVLIIGILSGVMLGVLNIRGIQSKSRDARRIGDLKKLQTALELYFADYRGYPKQITWGNVTGGVGSIISPNYINKVPTDPKEGTAAVDTGGVGVSCFNGKSNYGYYYITTDCTGTGCTLSGRYVMGAIVEVSSSAADSLCSSLSNCSGGSPAISCNCGGSYCYGVENPL